MATYQELQGRLDRGDVVILDGAVGTGLQSMGVPLHGSAWAAGALYPEAGREDYVDKLSDPAGKNDITAAEFLDLARKWVQEGVQVIGGSCGMGPDYIRPRREGLPARVPRPRSR